MKKIFSTFFLVFFLLVGVLFTACQNRSAGPTAPSSSSTRFTAKTLPSSCDLSTWFLNGNATFDSNTQIQLTNAQSQDSSAYSPTQVNLSVNQDFHFTVFKGSTPSPTGNAGMAFVIQSEGLNALGGTGGGDGFGDLNGFPPLNPNIAIHPSVDVEIDDFPNAEFPAEPPYDHIGILLNGLEETYVNPGGAQAAMPGNATVDDGNEHDFEITWNAATKLMTVFFDGRLITTYNADIVNTVFGGNPLVYWGLTCATGGGFETTYFRVVNCNPATPPPTATSSVTPSPSPSASVTPTASGTTTPNFTVTGTVSPSQTPSGTETPSDTQTASVTPSLTQSVTPTNTTQLTNTPQATNTPTDVFTDTPVPTDTPTPTFTPKPTPDLSACYKACDQNFEETMAAADALAESERLGVIAACGVVCLPTLETGAGYALCILGCMVNAHLVFEGIAADEIVNKIAANVAHVKCISDCQSGGAQ